MKVVGEEGTSLHDYIIFHKGDFLDSVYFQQNSFDAVDAAVSPERQIHVFKLILNIMAAELEFNDKEEARQWFLQMRQKFLDYNGVTMESSEFAQIEKNLWESLKSKTTGTDSKACAILEEIK